MLEYTIAQAKRLGVVEIWGEITTDDARKTPYLIEWYQRHGFTIENTSQPSMRCIATIRRDV